MRRPQTERLPFVRRVSESYDAESSICVAGRRALERTGGSGRPRVVVDLGIEGSRPWESLERRVRGISPPSHRFGERRADRRGFGEVAPIGKQMTVTSLIKDRFDDV